MGKLIRLLATLLLGYTLRVLVTSYQLPCQRTRCTKTSIKFQCLKIIGKTNSVTYPFYFFVGKFPKFFNFSHSMEKIYVVELNIFKENAIDGSQKILLDNFLRNFYIWSANVNGACKQKIKIGHQAKLRARNKYFLQILFPVRAILRKISGVLIFDSFSWRVCLRARVQLKTLSSLLNFPSAQFSTYFQFHTVALWNPIDIHSENHSASTRTVRHFDILSPCSRIFFTFLNTLVRSSFSENVRSSGLSRKSSYSDSTSRMHPLKLFLVRVLWKLNKENWHVLLAFLLNPRERRKR